MPIISKMAQCFMLKETWPRHMPTEILKKTCNSLMFTAIFIELWFFIRHEKYHFSYLVLLLVWLVQGIWNWWKELWTSKRKGIRHQCGKELLLRLWTVIYIKHLKCVISKIFLHVHICFDVLQTSGFPFLKGQLSMIKIHQRLLLLLRHFVLHKEHQLSNPEIFLSLLFNICGVNGMVS